MMLSRVAAIAASLVLCAAGTAVAADNGSAALVVAPLQLAQARAASVQVPEASRFVSNLADEAIASLSKKELSVPERITQFRSLLDEGFDIPQIARFVLGRYWRTATPEERAEYTKLFEEFIIQTYAQRFGDYGGESLKIGDGSRNGDDDIIVASQILRPNGPPVKVDWKLRPEQSSFKIVDVVVEGVSMAVTQRDDFSATIQSHGGKIEGLIAVLRDKVKGGTETASK